MRDGRQLPAALGSGCERRASRRRLARSGRGVRGGSIPPPHGPLRLGVERARALHLVPEELEPHRLLVQRAPDIDDPAADGERPGVLHERHARVPERDELGGERLPIELHPLADQLGVPLEGRPGEHAAGDGASRDHHGAHAAGVQVQPGQRPQALQLDATVGGEVVVREDRVGRDANDRRGGARRRRQEEREIASQLVRLLLPWRDGQHQP